MTCHKISLADKFACVDGYWEPKIIGEFEDHDLKIAKICGDFVWHKHDQTDELFLVVDGQLDMHFRDHVENLHTGDMIVVPRGVDHKPCAPDGECRILMVERTGTMNTGDADAPDRAVANPERI